MTYYDLLGVPQDASDEELKRAYRAQIKFFHPDVFTDNPEIARIKTLQLNEAYSILKDPVKRKLYDLTLAPPPQQRPSPPPPPPSCNHDSPGFRHDPPGRNPPPPPPPPSHKKNTFTPEDRIKMALCLVVIAIVFISVLGELSNAPPPTTAVSAPAVFTSGSSPTPTPFHINIKSGTVLHYPIDDAVAPLTVETPSGQNYYICLKSLAGNKDSEMSFYVKGGETEKIYVPLGKYVIYYATGDLWFGTKALFGDDTFCYKCDDVFDFYVEDDYYIGWTLTLSKVYDGNLTTQNVSSDDFPTIG